MARFFGDHVGEDSPFLVFIETISLDVLSGRALVNSESERLAAWSVAIRGSSLKRLLLVKAGFENWRLTPESMSFADLLFHLIEADQWLFKKLAEPTLEPMVGRAGTTQISAPEQFKALCANLETLGHRRASFLRSLSDAQLEATILDQRFGGLVTVWWVIVRGNLDHEVHHRGQVVAWLRAAGLAPQPPAAPSPSLQRTRYDPRRA